MLDSSIRFVVPQFLSVHSSSNFFLKGFVLPYSRISVQSAIRPADNFIVVLLLYIMALYFPVMMVADYSCGSSRAKRLGKVVFAGTLMQFIGRGKIIILPPGHH